MKINVVFFLAVLSVGCGGSKTEHLVGGGLTINNSETNTPLPKAFKDRAIYPGSDLGGYDLASLPGRVISVKTNGDPSVLTGIIRPDNVTIEVKPITEPLFYYKSRITLGAEAEGSYLQFAASFKGKQMAEIEFVDMARASIDISDTRVYNDILRKAKRWVHDNQKTDDSTKRIWILQVVLTKSIYTKYDTVAANGTVSGGAVVKVNGTIYNSNDVSTQSIILGVEAFDIDEFAASTPATNDLNALDFRAKINSAFLEAPFNVLTLDSMLSDTSYMKKMYRLRKVKN